MFPGPVLQYELITTSRRRRYFVARMAYGLLLLLLIGIESKNFTALNPWAARGHLAWSLFAQSLFVSFAGWQGGVLLLMIPALVAGVIADEAQRKTLHDLLASGLPSRSIVLGKLAARLLNAGVVVAIGVPIVALIGLFGGLDPWDVLYVYAATLALMLFVGGLSVLVSVVSRSPREAIITAYLLMGIWLILPMILDGILQYVAWPFSMLKPVNDLVLAGHPVLVWSRLSSLNRIRSAAGMDNPTMAPFLVGQRNDLYQGFLWLIALLTSAGTTFLALAVALLRPIRGFNGFAWWPRRKQLPRRDRPIAARSGCGDRPMLWKERRVAVKGGLTWVASLPAVLFLGTLLGCMIFEAAKPAFGEVIASVQGHVRGDSGRIELNQTLRSMGVSLFVLWGLAIASAGAVSVTSERERDTWTSLTASLLTREEVVWGKVFGAFWSARRLMLALVMMGMVGVLCGAIYHLGAIVAALGLLIYGWFAASLGVFVSLRSRNSVQALIVTALILVGLNLGNLLLAASVFGDGSSPAWAAGCSPSVEYVALLSYREAHALFSGQPLAKVGMRSTPFDVIALLTISLTAHGFTALLLTLGSLRGFDRLVDRPHSSKTQG